MAEKCKTLQRSAKFSFHNFEETLPLTLGDSTRKKENGLKRELLLTAAVRFITPTVSFPNGRTDGAPSVLCRRSSVRWPKSPVFRLKLFRALIRIFDAFPAPKTFSKGDNCLSPGAQVREHHPCQ